MSGARMSLDDRIQRWLLIVLRLSVAGALGLSLAYGEWGAFAYSLLALVLMFIPELIQSRVKVNLPVEFDLVLVLFMYAAVFLGKVGRAYEHFWWWDAALHTSAGFIMGYISFLVLYVLVQQGKIKTTAWLLFLTIFCFALAFGAIWEIFEFFMDQVLGGNLQRGSLHDTMWDLIVDSLGALVIAWIGMNIVFRQPKGFIARMTENFVRANPQLKGKL